MHPYLLILKLSQLKGMALLLLINSRCFLKLGKDESQKFKN